MMKSMGILLLSAAGFASAQTNQEPINLKCSIQSPSGEHFESWLVVDIRANSMRIDGEALELSLTNDAYAGVSRPRGGFVTVHRVDRNTGELTVTDVYQGQKVNPKKGICEKATPPAPKKF